MISFSIHRPRKVERWMVDGGGRGDCALSASREASQELPGRGRSRSFKLVPGILVDSRR